MSNIQISLHFFCRSDLRIATERLDSRESEFPPTPTKCPSNSKIHYILIIRVMNCVKHSAVNALCFTSNFTGLSSTKVYSTVYFFVLLYIFCIVP